MEGYFYIDESIHDKAGFIIAACVYSKTDLNEDIAKIIQDCGFDSKDFEFKSRTNYTKEPSQVKVRESLKSLLSAKCKIGIVIIPRDKRNELGNECIKGIKQFVSSNKINLPVSIYFDEGIKGNLDNTNSEIELFFNQDSKLMRGIQLADLAAHISSIQLKDVMGLISKKVKAGENSGYDPDMEIELGFEMWATLRYSYFNKGTTEYSEDSIELATIDVEPYGLYISEFCNDELARMSRDRFATMYLGCIH